MVIYTPLICVINLYYWTCAIFMFKKWSEYQPEIYHFIILMILLFTLFTLIFLVLILGEYFLRDSYVSTSHIWRFLSKTFIKMNNKNHLLIFICSIFYKFNKMNLQFPDHQSRNFTIEFFLRKNFVCFFVNLNYINYLSLI